MKTSLTRCIFFLFLLGMTSALTAQQVFWGDEPGQGDFDGGENGWVSNYVSGVDTTWEWISNGLIDGGSLDNQGIIIESPTASNGAMVFNSDKFTNGAGATEFNQPFPEYTQELVSPTIDLSGVPAGTALSLEFYQAFYWFQIAGGSNSASSFSVSADDGVTWSDPIDCNPDQPASFASNYIALNNMNSVRIPASAGLAGQSTVRLKFTFSANFYFWAIDDIKMVERITNDVSIAPGWYATSPYKLLPLSQVEPIVFMTDVGNFGGAEQQNVELDVTVTDDSGAVVYEETEIYGTLAADSLDENRVFGSFTPATLGTYTATYNVTSDSVDQDESNNTLSYSFEVTEDVFAKEDGPTGDIGAADGNWDDGVAKSWAYGNHFYVVDGTNLEAVSAEVVIANSNEAVDIPLYVRLWEWDAPVDTWLNDPDNSVYTCAPDARELVGRGEHMITGSEGSQEFITIPLTDELTLYEGVALKNNTHYILMVEMIDTGNDDSNVIQLGSNTSGDSQPYRFATSDVGHPRFGAMIGLNGSGPLTEATYNSTGFGTQVVPCVRMNLGPITSNTVDILEGAKVNVFPTPASNEVTVDVQLSKQYADATIKVVNAVGAIITEKNYDELQNEVLSINTSNWANGTYFLQVSTAEGVKTRHFVIQH